MFDTTGPVVIYAGSGTGAWEAAIANTLCAGDKVLSVNVGHFATLWATVARAFGLEVEVIETDWRHRDRSRRGRGSAAGGHLPCDQGRLHHPQRDLVRHHD